VAKDLKNRYSAKITTTNQENAVQFYALRTSKDFFHHLVQISEE